MVSPELVAVPTQGVEKRIGLHNHTGERVLIAPSPRLETSPSPEREGVVHGLSDVDDVLVDCWGGFVDAANKEFGTHHTYKEIAVFGHIQYAEKLWAGMKGRRYENFQQFFFNTRDDPEFHFNLKPNEWLINAINKLIAEGDLALDAYVTSRDENRLYPITRRYHEKFNCPDSPVICRPDDVPYGETKGRDKWKHKAYEWFQPHVVLEDNIWAARDALIEFPEMRFLIVRTIFNRHELIDDPRLIPISNSEDVMQAIHNQGRRIAVLHKLTRAGLMLA